MTIVNFCYLEKQLKNIEVKVDTHDDDPDIPITVTGNAIEVTDIYGNKADENGKLEITAPEDIVRVKVSDDFVSGTIAS